MTPDPHLVDRLAALPQLSEIPRGELEWLVSRGKLETLDAGTVMAPMGKPIKSLWIILSGGISVHVDRGAGPKHVISWRRGDVSGMLPYSRMSGPPGNNFLDEPSELLNIPTSVFPEMVHRCPRFTAYTVHSMLDRARSFNTSDLQDEKMISLGKLAAGLAHEINNPASATVRNAKLLRSGLTDADIASRDLGRAGCTDEMLELIGEIRSSCLRKPPATLSPIEQADRQDEIAGWLESHKGDPSLGNSLAETPVSVGDLDRLADVIPQGSLNPALRWLAAGCTSHLLAMEIENAATRVHDLVAAVKKFSYMDNLASPELVDVEPGLRNTIKVVEGKAKGKDITLSVDIEDDLPRVYATGGELNQVWLNLIDNALDAVPDSGSIEVVARKELDWVVVHVIDNGPGIPQDLQAHIFDAFFTTKPPGQGTGLGLDITRRLLRRYQGDITFESAPGRTDFRVNLIAEKAESAV